jgi:hypothetical protein
MRRQLTSLILFAAMLSLAQNNYTAATNHSTNASASPSGALPSQSNPSQSHPRPTAEVRADCIQNRRTICGKILQVLPEGLVVESGYTNLQQRALGRSWLVPGSILASRAPNLVESKEPASLCVGLVFLTDYPKSRRTKPKPFDYAILVGYPTGQYTYTSVGSLQRTVRRFSASLAEAVTSVVTAGTNGTSGAAAGVK